MGTVGLSLRSTKNPIENEPVGRFSKFKEHFASFGFPLFKSEIFKKLA
jgi:hypothetical protein